jgi:hypothetical protein
VQVSADLVVRHRNVNGDPSVLVFDGASVFAVLVLDGFLAPAAHATR